MFSLGHTHDRYPNIAPNAERNEKSWEKQENMNYDVKNLDEQVVFFC